MNTAIHNTYTKMHLTDMRWDKPKHTESPNKGKTINKDEDCTPDSIRRKRNRISRLIECNVQGKDFLFVTLTLDQYKVVDRTDLVEMKKNWEKFVKKMRYRFPDFQYVAVPETHQKGGWHLHFIAIGIDTKIDYNELREEIWGKGAVHVSHDIPIYKAGYIAKYIGKFRNNEGGTENYKKGDRVVWVSRGLDKGIKEIIKHGTNMRLSKIFDRPIEYKNSLDFLSILAVALELGAEIEYDTGNIINEKSPINRYVRLILNKGG